MGKNSTCTVPDCRTGYRSNKNKETNSKMALHGFPTNIDMINKWKKVIPRTWEQDGKSININNAVVCSLHFTDNDYRHQSLTNDQPLKLRLLKKDAIPSQFPGPSYLSKNPLNVEKQKKQR
nr:uncharacterized protein LOC121120118 isoform X2 [Lepeophtheirus salmonis]